MTIVKYLNAGIDAPRNEDVKRLKMPVPHPEEDEYRLFYNHRLEEVPAPEGDGPDGIEGGPDARSQGPSLVPTADFVSVQADHEPTDEEWRTVLKEEGDFSDEEIDVILGQG